MARICWLLIFGVACGDETISTGLADAGPSDAAVLADAAGLLDAAAMTARDASAPPPCDPFAASAAPMHTAAVTGRIDVIDYDYWDDTRLERGRTRNFGINFLTQTMPVRPPVDGPFFTGIAPDTCITTEIPNAMIPLGPARNVGTRVIISDAAGPVATFARSSAMGMVEYRASQTDIVRFFDRARTPLSSAYRWSTDGDPGARIGPFSAEIRAVADFEVTPALTSTGTPVLLDPANGTTIRWTTTATPAQLTIALSRALNANGDGRYVICRPRDDGEFLVPGAAIASIGATPDLAFGLDVARAAVAPFCNEGVTAGAAVHALVYLGRGVIR